MTVIEKDFRLVRNRIAEANTWTEMVLGTRDGFALHLVGTLLLLQLGDKSF